MAKRILYGLEDYARDRYTKAAPVAGVARPVTYTTPSAGTTPQSMRGEGQRLNRTVISPAAAQNVRRVADRPLIEDASNTNTWGQGQSEISTGERALTANELTLIRRLDDLSAAQENLSRVLNRRFSYDETSSPLYSILQKQYEQEAERAAGRAYASATANTGGYGSSYATMAGEDARRQVMSGFGDMQDELYQAAWDEFQAERQSATEWYAAAKQMAEDQELIVEEEKAEAAAKETGLNEDTYNLMIQAANEGWYTGTNKESVRARLNIIAAGNPNINVDAIMDRLTGEQAATITDAVKQFSASPTVSGAAEIMNAAKAAGTWEKDQPQVSASLTDAYIKNMKTPEAAGSLLGTDAATWSGMSDEERKKTIMSNAGAAARDGLITEEDYARILMSDVGDMAEAIQGGEIEKPATAVSDLVIDWQNYRDMGYMSEETYDKIMGELASSVNAPELLNKQAFTLGEHFADMANTFADWVGGKVNVDVPDWIGNLSGGMLDVISTAGGIMTATGNNGAIGKTVGVIQAANGILSNFDWYRRTIGMTDDQEKAMKDLLKHYKE